MAPGDSNNRRLIVQDDTDHEEKERFLLYRVQRDHGYLRSVHDGQQCRLVTQTIDVSLFRMIPTTRKMRDFFSTESSGTMVI
ncbi:hypothetical protein ACOME3_005698 [Neoechinorhynchus agilis]